MAFCLKTESMKKPDRDSYSRSNPASLSELRRARTSRPRFSRTLKNAYRRSRLQGGGLRCYSPGVGRWLSRDPIGERGGRHVYSTCFNSTINLVDKDGKIVPAVIVGVAVVAWLLSTDTANAPGPSDPTYESTGTRDLIVCIVGGESVGYFGSLVIKVTFKCVGRWVGRITVRGASTAEGQLASRGAAGELTGFIDQKTLELAASSSRKVTVYTAQTGKLIEGQGLSVSVENVALAKASGTGRILYEAELPQALIDLLVERQLVRESTTFMSGVTAKEYRFGPSAAAYVLKFFKIVEGGGS